MQIQENTEWKRLSKSKKLRQDLDDASGKGVTHERRIYIKLPQPAEHKNHPTGRVSHKYVHRGVIILVIDNGEKSSDFLLQGAVYWYMHLKLDILPLNSCNLQFIENVSDF